ncbi:MAG: glycosyltransferase family 4 protein [Acidimicrobiia bacterium]
MNVLYLITVLGPSGAEQSVVAMAPALAERGVHLELAYFRDRPGTDLLLAKAKVGVVSLRGGGGVAGRFVRALRLARDRQPDVIHTTLTEANIAGRAIGAITGIPVVSSLVNVTYGAEHLASPDKTRSGVRARHLLDALTARKVARFHSVTNVVADVMAPRLRVARDRIDVVPRGRDPASLGERSAERRDRVRRCLGIEPGQAMLLAAARQDYQKGLQFLVEAMPRVLAGGNDAVLLVAGRPGSATPELQAAVERLGLHGNVRFLGLRDDVADLLCAADVFVLPSLWEGMGGVLLEAMALETPIVASDLPTLRDAVPGNDYARFAPCAQPAPLADAILATLAEPAAAAERAARGRQRFLQEFTVARVADQMVSFYERALVTAGAGPGRRAGSRGCPPAPPSPPAGRS